MLSWLRNTPRFMEPGNSLSFPQKPAVGSHSQPNEFSPHIPILFLRCILILSPHQCSGLPSFSFLRVFQLKPYIISHLFHSFYASCQPRPRSSERPNNILLGVQIMKPYSVQFSPFSCLFVWLVLEYRNFQ